MRTSLDSIDRGQTDRQTIADSNIEVQLMVADIYWLHRRVHTWNLFDLNGHTVSVGARIIVPSQLFLFESQTMNKAISYNTFTNQITILFIVIFGISLLILETGFAL